jgi:hypothetical protein
MKRIENDCVGCDYCVNCGRKEVEHFYCDKCGDEGSLYEYDGDELCESCLLKAVPKVEGSEW